MNRWTANLRGSASIQFNQVQRMAKSGGPEGETLSMGRWTTDTALGTVAGPIQLIGANVSSERAMLVISREAGAAGTERRQAQL